MNKFSLVIVLLLCLSVRHSMAQNDLPSVPVKGLNGRSLPFSAVIAGGDTVTVVSFWATWCIPCITEMETISDQLPDRKKETVLKFVAVSVDDARTSAKVRAFVKGKGWDFDIYLDTNNELKRAFNINDIPHILIIKKGKVVYQHTGYVPGNEDELFAKLKTL